MGTLATTEAPTGVRVAGRLRQLRLQRELTLAQLAERLDGLGNPISLSGLSKIEKHQRRVDVDDLVSLALALDVSPNLILLRDSASQSDEIQLAPTVAMSEARAWDWGTCDDPRTSELVGSTLPTVWNIPSRNPNFTGRSCLLDQLHRLLAESGSVAVHSLRGMGGVGKTQLAIEYAHRHANYYELAWWVPAERPELIPNHLAHLADALGLRADGDLATVVDQVLGRLRDQPRWLLVFDNAEDPETLRPYLPNSRGHVLITTRRAGFAGISNVLDVEVLDEAEALALLHRRIPSLTDDQGHQLAAQLGDLPLALEQAAAYLDATRLPVTDYLTLLQQRGGDMLGKGTVIGYQSTLATVCALALDRIAKQSPAAKELLGLCAYLTPEAIPLDLFTSHPEQLPPTLTTAVKDPVEWADTIGILVNYSLARRSGHTLSIHPLLQTALRHHGIDSAASRTQDHERHGVVLDLLRADLPSTIAEAPQDWPRWQQLLPHVLAAIHHDFSATPTNPDTSSWLLDRAAACLQVLGQPAEARPLLERALAITEATFGPDHPTVITGLHNLALALRDLGQPAEARSLLERALPITEAESDPESSRDGVEVTKPTRIFLSWCHQDQALKEALLRDLLPALGVFTDLDVEWWEDSHLICGEQLTTGIVDRLDEADFSLLLLSTRYFARPFICSHELPRFAGPLADKSSLPVALSPLPAFGPEHNLWGVERQIVSMQDGRSFSELSGAKRTSFANELAAAIRRRALSLNGYRTL